MRVRVLRLIASAFGVFPPGVVVDVPAGVGREWCSNGIAMQDKSLDGASETKVLPRDMDTLTEPRRKPKKRAKYPRR